MARRSKAREVALQMLYQIDVNPDVDAYAVREMIREQIEDEELSAFTWSLFVGVREVAARNSTRRSGGCGKLVAFRMAATDRKRDSPRGVRAAPHRDIAPHCHRRSDRACARSSGRRDRRSS
jgi:hypothetical protein